MATLIDTDYLRSSFDISEDILNSRLEKNIGAASRRLRKWVSDEMYQSVSTADDGNEKKEDFKLAEANLAMHFAILGLNTPITSKGILQNTRSKDFSVITYLSPDKIAAIKQMYFEEAEEILREYIEDCSAKVVEIVD